MRLAKIKLAGFKSFVDPTTLTLSADLTGIVGPNGCGKSNIVDALLWVMGESSAKHLRGDSMRDVIFNGSNSRKPVGQASIEIVFDVGADSFGGQYASYSEISIKRQLTRDGASVYQLNGTRCRRRDIIDLFLGTGLGSATYAVIEQGMISRVIEAKPEELRAFIEEAAGISKYKERRRETQNRIHHTRDNMSRINDINLELNNQLKYLQRQAKAAERYKYLREEERRLKAGITALDWQELKRQSDGQKQLTRQRETALEAAKASLRGAETTIERVRQAQYTASARLDKVQQRCYAVAADISRLEQAIHHRKERNESLERELNQAQRDLTEAQHQLSTDLSQLNQLVSDMGGSEPVQTAGLEREQCALRELNQAEQNLQAWQSEWDEFMQRASDLSRNEKVDQTRLTHLESGVLEIEQRIQTLRAESDGLAPQAMAVEIESRRAELERVQRCYESLLRERQARQAAIREAREAVHVIASKLDGQRAKQQTTHGRLVSLQALQRSKLGKDQTAVLAWLKDNDLMAAPRLAQEVTVPDGWESALEAVLADRLDALCVEDLDALTARLSSLEEGSLSAVDRAFGAQLCTSERGSFAPLLKEKVHCRWLIDHLLVGVYGVRSLEEAMALRAQLRVHESLVTKDGDRVGPGWLRINRQSGEKAGILSRQREIKVLEQESCRLQQTVMQTNDDLNEWQTKLKQLEENDAQLQTRLDSLHERLANLRSALAATQARLEQTQSRRQQIMKELQTLEERKVHNSNELEGVRSRLGEIHATNLHIKEQRSELATKRAYMLEVLQEHREAWRAAHVYNHEIALRLESMRSQKISLQRALERNQTLVMQLSKRCDDRREALNANEAPGERMKAELDRMLQRRTQVETELRDARHEVQSFDDSLRRHEQSRSGCEQEVGSARDALEQIRIEAQATSVRLNDIHKQLRESGYEPEVLLSQLADDGQDWQERLAAVERKIQRLGPVNLAAIDEVATLSERKSYVDRQYEDLSEALATLESAIRKIDRETRLRFKETLDRVNTSLQSTFPKLFGGGQAHLALTDENLLETGITIMVRPPGKRISTIHLLSGGEKALTAIALVFALFELNPAPFCLLDEVDAPLDDANVVRFGNMLKSMAERVQFIFVTHNKITMEIAQRLVGVTMEEPGVSRLVAVDMEAAVQMAATG